MLVGSTCARKEELWGMRGDMILLYETDVISCLSTYFLSLCLPRFVCVKTQISP